MSIALSEFWSRLVSAGITDAPGCKQMAAAFAAAHQGDPPANAASLAKFLVRTGQLTSFQAKALVCEPEPSLRAGAFVITGDQPPVPFRHWLPVRTVCENSADPVRNGFLLRIPLGSLDDTRRAALAAHAKVSCPTLQTIELSGGAQSSDANRTVDLFSPIPEGGSLWQVLQKKPRLSARKTIRIGVDVARALAAMHQDASTTLVHGAVAADHVWVTPKGNAVLLRDPSITSWSPHSDVASSWIDCIEPAARYAAPELADPTAVATPRSDLYALGCLLFSLRVGRPPFEGTDTSALFAAHQDHIPDELQDAATRGAEGDPILRVVAYAMAKDPAARFDSVAAFADALQRVGEVIQEHKQSASKQPPPKAASATNAPKREAVPAAKLSAAEAPAGEQIAKATQPTVARESAATYHTNTAARPAPPATANDSSPAVESAAAATRPATSTPPPVDRTPPAQTGSDTRPVDDVAAVDRAATAPDREPPQLTEQGSIAIDTSAPETSAPETNPEQVAATAEAELSSAELSSAAETAPTRRRRRRRKKNRLPILAGMMILPLLMLGLAIALSGSGDEETNAPRRPPPRLTGAVPRVGQARRDSQSDPNQTNPTAPAGGPATQNGYEIVDSDRLLWVPPYPADTQPPSLELLPPGPAALISVRLAAMTDKAAAQPMLTTLQPELDPLIDAAVSRAGVARDQIKRCTIGLYPGRGGWPEVALAVELETPTSIDSLTQRWGALKSQTPDGVTLYAGEDLDGDAYFVAGGERGKLAPGADVERFAVASLDRIREVAELDGGPIPLVRSLQTLWDRTSRESDLVAVITPNFLFADGRELIASTVPEFQDPLKRWLIPDVAAASITVTAADQTLYVELREVPSGGATSPALLKSFRDEVASWPQWADDFILQSVPDPSWRLLASRLPLMLRFVGQQTRSTIEGETVVASLYLPPDAAAQVMLASMLAMNTPPGGPVVASKPKSTEPLTVQQMLDRPMSISFTQESLQFAVAAVVDEFTQSLPNNSTMPEVRIIGSDLEKNGITQNQQIRGFEKQAVPLRTVLTDLVLGANPDKTATGPKDPKQSLVWVVHPSGKEPQDTEILITTRDAAANQYELPAEFRP
ncbi:hypothetical protein FYK55_24800 [Roseiconus nitratireducens]|uniref:Protein kinase domain-containing protein n=1 Tax=Roseiconus nitratireducens TaxID=2605748 RepID=A0A5M6CVP5_9BACT|nr:hypothetical protein [Roseiconus nitratireducens]KAA5539328.1 hypothetical protein FYK55_24800 [Roseiconus nitratireducens]